MEPAGEYSTLSPVGSFDQSLGSPSLSASSAPHRGGVAQAAVPSRASVETGGLVAQEGVVLNHLARESRDIGENSPEDRDADVPRAPDTDSDAPVERSHVTRTLVLAGGHTFSAAFLTLANKWALDLYPHAATVTMLQIVATVLVALFVRFTGIAQVDHFDANKAWNYLPAASMFFVQLLAGQKVLEAAGVQMFITMRCSAPLVTFVAEATFLNGPKPGLKTGVPLVVMALGATLFMYDNEDMIETSVVLWGTLFLIVMPANSLIIKKSLADIGFTAWGMVYYHNLLSLVVYIPVAILTGELRQILASDLPSSGAMVAIAVTCVLGVTISAFGLNVRHAVRATTFTVLGVLNKIISLTFDALFFDEPFTAMSAIAITLLIGGGLTWQLFMGKKSVTVHRKGKPKGKATPRWVSVFNCCLAIVCILAPILGPVLQPPPESIVVRAFDLGGSGMRTVLYEPGDDTVNLTALEPGIQLLGHPPRQQDKMADWIRSKVPTLDGEIAGGVLFGGSGVTWHLLNSDWVHSIDPTANNDTSASSDKNHLFGYSYNGSELALWNSSKFAYNGSWHHTSSADGPGVGSTIHGRRGRRLDDDGQAYHSAATLLEVPGLVDKSDNIAMMRAAHISLRLGSEAHLNFALGTGVAISGTNARGEQYSQHTVSHELCDGLCYEWPGINFDGVNMPLVEALGGAYDTYPSYTLSPQDFLKLIVRVLVEHIMPKYDDDGTLHYETRPTVITFTGKVAEVVLAPLLAKPYYPKELASHGTRLMMGPTDGGVLGAAYLALKVPLVPA